MRLRPLAFALLSLAASPAAAQGLDSPSAGIEATTDDRRRGLSWSGGRATLVGDAAVPIGEALRLDVAVAGLRDSRRHGDADVGIDLGGRWTGEAAGWRLRAGAAGHLFAGADGLNYAELQAGGSYTLGPASLDLSAAYAPSQRAIGGDNLYLSAGLDAGVPATPITVYIGGGHSSGGGDGVRARRLRPGGDYWDYRLGAEYVLGPATAGARLTGTSIDPVDVPAGPYVDRHFGTVVAGYLRFGF